MAQQKAKSIQYRKNFVWFRPVVSQPILACPFMYGTSFWGIVIDPSSFWYISRIGINIRGDAATVLLSEWQKVVAPLPFSPPGR